MLECRGGRRGDDGRLHIEAATVLCVRQRRYRSSKAEGFDLQDYGGCAVGWSGREEEEEETAARGARGSAVSENQNKSAVTFWKGTQVKAAKLSLGSMTHQHQLLLLFSSTHFFVTSTVSHCAR